MLRPIPGAERRIEVKFNDDADDNGRTPGRPLPARYVVPLPEGFEEDDSKPAQLDDDDEPPAMGSGNGGGGGSGGGGGGGGGSGGNGGTAGEDDADDPMGECWGVVCTSSRVQLIPFSTSVCDPANASRRFACVALGRLARKCPAFCIPALKGVRRCVACL